jgi:hypothetical protein
MPLYVLGGLIKIHPSQLGHILSERKPLSPEVRDLIVNALQTGQHGHELGAR